MQADFYIFRNTTIENFFSKFNAEYSGYNDISYIPEDAKYFIWAYLAPVKTNATLFTNEVESYIHNLELVLSSIPKEKVFYAFNMYKMHFVFLENEDFSVQTTIEAYNKSLQNLSNKFSNLKILDFATFCNKHSLSDLIDWKFYYMSQMQLNPKLSNGFNDWLQKEIAAIAGQRKKCLVLDLDNTLWGGILGEDGIEGILIGNTYPGSAYLDFQQNIIELSKSGIILTVCSKNNEKDVIDAWNQNPFIKIKKELLATWRINWSSKADNIVEIAKELNIGLDSMVFIDDNPTERELVKQILPMVETPDFPLQPYSLPTFFERICTDYFQIYTLTSEDKNKLKQYKANAERLAFQKSFVSFEDYLRSLDITLEIQKLNSMNLPRIAQMTQKTNQFNLTTKRYTNEDLLRIENNGGRIYCISVSDKFGDHGITGAAIITINKNKKEAEIDSLLLSCRILGKKIESIFLNHILQQLQNIGIEVISSTYIPTTKNAQVSDFYEKNNFNMVTQTKNGTKEYVCQVGKLNFGISDIYKIKS